jgi:Helix-hairpin-helix motif
MDEGAPTSYLLLAKDTPVFGSDGLVIGTIREVLCEPREDIFDGLVIATNQGDRYVPAECVAAIHERGVDLELASSEVTELSLPAPRRQIKFAVGEGERPWIEVLNWLCEHLGHLLHPGDPRIVRAREHLAERKKALALARDVPGLALEAGVGRPDLPGSFHGGVVDVNHAPVQVIASLPGFDLQLAARLVAAREELDGFSSLEDLGTVLDLPGDEVEHIREHVVFLPR